MRSIYTVFTQGDRSLRSSRDRSPRPIASCKHAITVVRTINIRSCILAYADGLYD